MLWSATDVRAEMLLNGGTKQGVTATGAIEKNKWSHVAYVQEGTTAKIYVNGVLSASGTIDAASLADMGETGQNYIGRSQFSGDKYLHGYLDEIVFAKRAMSEEEIGAMGTFPEPDLSDEAILAELDIPTKDCVKENIALATEIKGYPVTWASSNEDVVYPHDIPNGDYTIPAGKVIRPEADTKVTLTATVHMGERVLEKDIEVNVAAKPADVGETEAYLYVYFRGNVNGEPENLAIHLAASEDSYKWFDLNGNHPILKSEMSTACLRDPYLIRSRDGDRFYLLATDLDTQDGQGWGPWSLEGSKYLMVWESDDLVNWSEQRMVKFSNDDMGCAWAPEAIWDPDTEEYLVYASGKDLTLDSPIDTVYVVRTRDFRTFSEPEYFVRPYENNGVTTYGSGTTRIAAIDSNIIQANDGRFYHFYKKYNSVVQMLVSDHASGPWQEVPVIQTIGGEGTGSFVVKGTDDQYCLMIDNYSVYVPYLTDDIASGAFTQGSGTVVMPTGSKHGGFLPVNAEEYARVLEKWDNPAVDPEGSAPRYTFDFESDSSEYLKGGATVAENAERGSNTLVLDGVDSYFEFPAGIFDKQSTFTLSFDVMNENSPTNAMTFAAGTGDEHYIYYKNTDTEIRSAITITSWQYEEKAISEQLTGITDKWMHIDFMVTPTSMEIYKDGVLIASNEAVTKSVYHLAEEGLNAYLGKSMYAADPYFKGEIDNVKLYYRTLSTDEIAENAGLTDDKVAELDADSVSFGCDVNRVTGNITLPSEGIYGSTITWATSDESLVALDGTVNLPETNLRKVILTGTFTYNGNTVVRDYTLRLRPADSVMNSTLTNSAPWAAQTIKKADGVVTYKFNMTPNAAGIDAGIAFIDSDTTPSAWSHLSMVVRTTTGGYFDARNGGNYLTVDTVNYEVGKTYPMTIEANIATKTYSVYVDVDGETKTIANNYAFRSDASCNDIGKVLVYAGSGINTAGQLTVTDLQVILPDTVIFSEVEAVDGKLVGSILSGSELGESKIMIVEYTDENMVAGVTIEDVTVKEGETVLDSSITSGKKKVFLWNSLQGMQPYAEAIIVD